MTQDENNAQTLYEKLILVENVRKIVPESIYAGSAEKGLILSYEKNPVMQDALKGRMSIEDSLNKLSQVYKGTRILLPKRKDEIHNARLSQIGELVSEPDWLKTNGIFAMDNAVTTPIYTTALIAAMSYGSYLLMSSGESPEVAKNTALLAKFMFVFMSTIFAPSTTAGTIFKTRAGGSLADESRAQARYIDQKIIHLLK